MKKEIAELWVKALRSGEYKQARGKLKVVDSSESDTSEVTRYCCLGVLCELYRLQTGRGEWVRGDTDVGPTALTQFKDSSNGEAMMSYGDLIPTVKQWSGCNSFTGEFLEGGMRLYLIDLNDIGKKTFPEIADVIEKHWETL